jgi:hypothetical protein
MGNPIIFIVSLFRQRRSLGLGLKRTQKGTGGRQRPRIDVATMLVAGGRYPCNLTP